MIGFNLNKAKRHFTEVLTQRYPQREAEQLMRILLEDLFDIDLTQEMLHPDLRIEEDQYALLKGAVEKLLEGMPVQYVTSVARFDGLTLQVDPSVLIPRPETEELVLHAVKDVPADRPLRLWDVGTGSGCIAIALKQRLSQAAVLAIDRSEQALALAKRNAERNEVEVEFIQDDVLNPTSPLWEEPVDLVVSNPPYVRESERIAMESNVLEHEPQEALFVPDDDPLRFYRQILRLAYPQLPNEGCVWFEINEAMGEEMLHLCREMDYEGALFEDFAGKTRFCKARKIFHDAPVS